MTRALQVDEPNNRDPYRVHEWDECVLLFAPRRAGTKAHTLPGPYVTDPAQDRFADTICTGHVLELSQARAEAKERTFCGRGIRNKGGKGAAHLSLSDTILGSQHGTKVPKFGPRVNPGL